MSLQAFRAYSESTKGNVVLTISGLGLLAIAQVLTRPGMRRVGLTIFACAVLVTGIWKNCKSLADLLRTGPSPKQMNPRDRKPYLVSTTLSCVVCLALCVLVAYALIQSIGGALAP